MEGIVSLPRIDICQTTNNNKMRIIEKNEVKKSNPQWERMFGEIVFTIETTKGETIKNCHQGKRGTFITKIPLIIKSQ